jgi:hypothetical protein
VCGPGAGTPSPAKPRPPSAGASPTISTATRAGLISKGLLGQHSPASSPQRKVNARPS